ncbi:hypothetical protein CGC49_02445 [Capnocytophaga sp. H4358]|uniref:OmpH family outer membrane protein n=1 Tax=Capnocytophaga sp. H4358 TaxID=1945658 RepID=UPI000BB1B342|nr:OmpH family outer membrane protein [Capnocytophaga sp. H4358]ATA72268.1 hypothetical protein CGC49_02445 [Capnocytophaga sp. H4358]
MNKIVKNIISLGLLIATTMLYAQKSSRIGYVDMDYVLSNLEEYQVASEQFALQVAQWQVEIEKREADIQKEKQKLDAEKSLLTPELIKDKEQEIALLEYQLNAYKEQKFGKEGEYFTQKFMLAKPIQDQVFNIVQEIGKLRNYDMVFEKSEVSMLYSANQHNLSNVVLLVLKRKDNAEDRNRDFTELLKESYDFEFVDERTKRQREIEKERAKLQAERQKVYEQERKRKAEEKAQRDREREAKVKQQQQEREERIKKQQEEREARRKQQVTK